MEKVYLDGDLAKAATWIGWAESKLRALKMMGQALVTKRYPMPIDDVEIIVNAQEGNDWIRITAQSGRLNLFVTELASSLTAPQTQKFSMQGAYQGDFKDPDHLVYADYKFQQYDAAVYKNSVYVTNWWEGALEKYSMSGNMVDLATSAKLVTPIKVGGGKAFQQIVIGQDRIAITGNVLSNARTIYVYDMAYTPLYNITIPLTSTGASGIEIVGDKLYISWNQEVYDESGLWHAYIAEHDLFTGAQIRVFTDESPNLAGEFFEALSAYKGLLYATDTRQKSVRIYSIADGTFVRKVSLTDMVTDGSSPRGLALGKNGAWITGFSYHGFGYPYPDYPNDIVRLYHYDLGLNLKQKIGSRGLDPGQFIYPFGVALQEAE